MKRESIIKHASQLGIEVNGHAIVAVEFRNNGEIWLLSLEFDGYHVPGSFSQLSDEQKLAVLKLHTPRYFEFIKEEFVKAYSFFDERLKKIDRKKITIVDHGDHYYLSCVYYGKKYGHSFVA